MMSTNLKREFLELLERDREFRYAVAGYLGLSEILKKLDTLAEGQTKLWENQNKLWENQQKLLENQNKLWEEVKNLREEQNKLWENQMKFWETQNKFLENQNKLWEEVKALREGQNKLWENQNKLWEEVKSLREGQDRLWENQQKLWEEVRSLREGQNKLWEEVKALREEQTKLWENQNKLWENQNKLWKEVRELRKNFRRLERRFERGMKSLSTTVGVTLDYYTASFVEELLMHMKIPKEKIRVRANITLYYNGLMREIDIFNYDPLVVGEVTTHVENVDEAMGEINKVIEDVKFAEKIFNRKVFLAILAIETLPKTLMTYVQEEAQKYNIKFIHGKIITS